MLSSMTPRYLACCHSGEQVGGQGAVGTSTVSGSSAQQQTAGKVTRMCVTVAMTFTVAWMPYQLNRFVFSYGNVSHALLVKDAVKTLAFVNSCINPLVYAVMWRPFRVSVIQVRPHTHVPACMTRFHSNGRRLAQKKLVALQRSLSTHAYSTFSVLCSFYLLFKYRE